MNLFLLTRTGGGVYAFLHLAREALQLTQRLFLRLVHHAPRPFAGASTRLQRGLGAVIRSVESPLIDIERRRGLSQPWTVVAQRFTATDNRGWWNTHDWSRLGEEWTPNAAWKAAIVERFLVPFVPEGSAVIEIGPGGGRWTEILNARASHVYVLDIAEAPLRVCQERFALETKISFVKGDGRTIPVHTASIDALWSYDVFVHINPADARSYIAESARVLRNGAYAVIHHPGQGSTRDRALQHRSDLTDHMVRAFAAASGFEIVLQTSELVNDGDVLTVLRKTA